MATPRRNGQLSSCEPCRTSKLRCDHTSPVCGRCERRDLPCTYHPAPLTQVIAGIRPKKKIRVARDSTGPGIIHGLRNDNSAWTRKKASASAPGFLGQTSYSDVFTDISSGLPAGTIHTVGHDAVPVDSKQINLGAQVLVLLENLTFYREVVTTRFKKYKGWTLGWPMTNLIFTVVEEMWDSLKQEEMDTSARALLMSRRLFETFTKDFEVHLSTTWEEFKIASSGRWETVGLLFIITGLATDLVPHDDPIFNTMDAKSIAITASAVGDICIQFCDNTGIVNDLVSWLLLHQTSLLAVVYGESDFRPWRKLGDLSTTVFALGLHQDSSAKVPFFLVELRKRTMVAAFTVDKVLATFLGRPPLISWRYCNIPMPLDLSMEEIVADSIIRDAAIARLDENSGWNREGSLTKGARARIALITSVFREKVLEMSLSWQTENLSQKVEELSQESRRLRQDLPDFLHWRMMGEGTAVSGVEEMFLFEIHLDFLYNDFLLYRTLGQRTQTQPEEIIGISREILQSLIMIVSKRTRCAEAITGTGWALCLPGLPAAGVLSAELLRRYRLIVQGNDPNFPRSEVIQNLTLFASYLDTIIKPDEGNYRVALQGQKAIRHVLDQVLSGEQVSPTINDNNGGIERSMNDDHLLDGVNIDDHDLFLTWFDGNMQQMSESWLSWVNLT